MKFTREERRSVISIVQFRTNEMLVGYFVSTKQIESKNVCFDDFELTFFTIF